MLDRGKPMKLRQAEIVKNGNVHMVTWLPTSLRAKPGMSLIDKKGSHWTVLRAYRLQIENEDVNHGWKVGGLA